MNKQNNNLYELRSILFDHADTMIAILDKNLILIDANIYYLKTLRVKKEDIMGKPISLLIPEAKRNERMELLKRVLKTGEPETIDEIRTHPNFDTDYVRLRVFKLGDGLAITLKNISDLKESIDELETFIYKSSHEMRGPIANIFGLVNLAATDVKNLDEAQHFNKLIGHQAERLDLVMKLLIEATEIRKNEKTIELIKFDDLMKTVFKSFEPKIEWKEIAIEHHISVRKKFRSDTNLLFSLFHHLIDNAFKYRKADMKDVIIKISIEDDAEGILIKVVDNGIGIPYHLQDKVFKMFYRATEKSSGGGLGLYVVKHVIRKLGGRITLDSKENIGTMFTITIPNIRLK